MNELTISSWQRQGSSLVWDPALLTPLLQQQGPLSLRQVLLWTQQGFPSASPVSGRTILVAGLQTCLEVLSASEVSIFLHTFIQPLVRRWQDTWPNRALVFGLSCSWNQWRTDPDEYAYFLVRQNHEIDVTHALWGGAAPGASKIMVSSDQSTGSLSNSGKSHGPRVGGLYVRRVS
jgi:hypothetical protein